MMKPLDKENWGRAVTAIAKIVEVNSSSTQSLEDVIQTGIDKVTGTVKNVQGAWVNEQKVMISDDKITEYCVNLRSASWPINRFI